MASQCHEDDDDIDATDRNPLMSVPESVLGNVVMNSCDVIPINNTCCHSFHNYL
jgi:hypothetical protein